MDPKSEVGQQKSEVIAPKVLLSREFSEHGQYRIKGILTTMEECVTGWKWLLKSDHLPSGLYQKDVVVLTSVSLWLGIGNYFGNNNVRF